MLVCIPLARVGGGGGVDDLLAWADEQFAQLAARTTTFTVTATVDDAVVFTATGTAQELAIAMMAAAEVGESDRSEVGMNAVASAIINAVTRSMTDMVSASRVLTLLNPSNSCIDAWNHPNTGIWKAFDYAMDRSYDGISRGLREATDRAIDIAADHSYGGRSLDTTFGATNWRTAYNPNDPNHYWLPPGGVVMRGVWGGNQFFHY
jgi:hypothetical protein